MKRILLAIIPLLFLAGMSSAQNTVTMPSCIDFGSGVYQTSWQNISGTALKAAGWSLTNKRHLNAPITATVTVDSIGGSRAKFTAIFNRYGVIDTSTIVTRKDSAFWIPDANSTLIQDSLFYVVPDSLDLTVGDRFVIWSSRVYPSQQYNFRLVFSTDSVKGTQTTTSQPVFIGHGVQSMYFGVFPYDTAPAVYRALYATRYSGFYSGQISTDTLADSTYSVDATVDQWNYQEVTGVDTTRWIKVERIGKAVDDTSGILWENLIIRSF